MQRLQGIAVSPGVAIGEALVMDTEGFRIPRRFVSRDAVDDELERLEQGHRRRRRRNSSQSRHRGQGIGRAIRRHLRRAPANADRPEAAVGVGQHDSRSALSRRNTPSAARCAATLKVFPRLSGGTFAERASDIFDIEKRLLAKFAGPAPRGAFAAHFAGRDPGARSHAQRNRQFRSQICPRFCHRSRRPRQPHGDRGRRHGNSRRRRHRAVSDRRFRRRPGHYRRPSGRRDSAARRRNGRPLSARSRSSSAVTGAAGWKRCAICRRKPPTACGSNLLGNIEFPYEVDHCVERGADGIGFIAPSFFTSRPRSSPPRKRISKPIRA